MPACVQDVLQAAEGDVDAAAWMLAELHSPVTPGVSPSMSPWASPLGSPLGSPQGSPHISPARSHMPQPQSSPKAPDLPSIAEVAGQGSQHAGRPAHRDDVGALSNHAAKARPVPGTARVASKPRKTEGAVRPGVTTVNNVAESKLGEARDAESTDAYHSFRGEALQLTRRWQRAARKATSAFSGVDTAPDSTRVHASIAAGTPVRALREMERLEAQCRRRHDSSLRARGDPGRIACLMCRRQSL